MSIQQSLFLIQFPKSAPYTQVEDWPRTISRSCEGAIHVRPGGTKKVTKTELDHLKTKAPWGRLIRVIKKVAPKPPSAEKAKADEVKSAKAAEVAKAAAKTPKAGATKGGKPKRVGGAENSSEGSSG